MSVNLVTRVRNFSIHTETFSSSNHDVQDGCVTPGQHRVMRFDFLSYNAGSSDMVIGSPASRPDLFVWSSAHGHYHLKDFNQFILFTATGNFPEHVKFFVYAFFCNAAFTYSNGRVLYNLIEYFLRNIMARV